MATTHAKFSYGNESAATVAPGKKQPAVPPKNLPPAPGRPRPPPPPARKRPPPPPPPPGAAAKKSLPPRGKSDKKPRFSALPLPPKSLPPSSSSSSSRGGKGGAFAPIDLSVASGIFGPRAMRDVNESFKKNHQVGQGTYGSVYKGADKITGEVVALKRINIEQEENGFPITAIREIKILCAMNCPNIVKLKEIVTSKDKKDEIPKSVFMVFEYLEYDLTGIIETPAIRLSAKHVKCWSKQLLDGMHYMHKQKLIHRDLKPSNIFVNAKGQLKIGDWGLARSWNESMKCLTNRVITLWYRPPELLLGCVTYDSKVDMWSAGCIIAEMFRRSQLMKGRDEAQQLEITWGVCGTPTLEEWPDIRSTCPLWKNHESSNGGKRHPRRLRESLLRPPCENPSWLTDNAVSLIDKLLTNNPEKRWSADEALGADYFFEDLKSGTPTHNDISMDLGMKEVHEWEARNRKV